MYFFELTKTCDCIYDLTGKGLCLNMPSYLRLTDLHMFKRRSIYLTELHRCGEWWHRLWVNLKMFTFSLSSPLCGVLANVDRINSAMYSEGVNIVETAFE